MDTPEETPRFISLAEGWPRGPLGPTFLTSYTFNGPFFESVLLPTLVQRRASPIVVFVDRSMGYSPTVSAVGSLKAAGRDYYLLPVDWGSAAFHPKVHLFCIADVALVGSGNLTPSGCGGNIEAFDRLDGAVEASALSQVRQFFRKLLSDPRVALPSPERNRLLSRIAVKEVSGGDASFLHTLDAEPLHGRVEALDLGSVGDDCLLAAPFQDYDHETSRRLTRMLRLAKCKLAANPDQPPPTPSGFVTGRLVDDHNRQLHAKLVYRRGPESALLCVGSANLSRAAWEGRNAEAIVVRQSTEASEFERFIEAVRFEAGTWGPPAEIERAYDHAGPQVQQPRVSLDGNRLTIELEAAEFELTFHFDNGDFESPLDLERLDETTWAGTLNALPRGCAHVVVRAPGHRPAYALVLRVGELASAVWQSRLRRAGVGYADDPLRLELLGQIGELLGRLHLRGREQPSDVPDSGIRSKPPPGKSGPEASGAFELVDKLEESLRSGAGNLNIRMRELARLIDVALSVWAPNENAESSDRWSPLMLVDVTVNNIDDDSPKSKDAALGVERGYGEGLSEELVAAVERLARGLVGKLSEPSDRSTEDALVIHETVVRMLITAARNSPAARDKLASDLITWLVDGWAVERWPEMNLGWILAAHRQAESLPEIDYAQVLAVLCEWIHWVDPEVDESTGTHHSLDRAKAVFSGVLEAGGDALRTSMDSQDSLSSDLIKYTKTLRRLRSHHPRYERARELIEPLWDLEHRARKVRRLERTCVGLRGKLEDAEAAMKRASHRSASHKAAAETKQEIEPKLADYSEQLDEARQRFALAKKSALASKNGDLLPLIQRWEQARWSTPADTPIRMVRHEHSSCSACNIQFNGVFARIVKDPLFVGQCPNCGVLVATGPEAGR